MARPSVFRTVNERRHVCKLVKDHGASGAQRILSADPGTPEASPRSSKLFPDPVTVSLPTLVSVARSYGVTLRRGRRAQVA